MIGPYKGEMTSLELVRIYHLITYCAIGASVIQVAEFLEQPENNNCNWIVGLLQEATAIDACCKEPWLISIGFLEYLNSDFHMLHSIIER